MNEGGGRKERVFRDHKRIQRGNVWSLRLLGVFSYCRAREGSGGRIFFSQCTVHSANERAHALYTGEEAKSSVGGSSEIRGSLRVCLLASIGAELRRRRSRPNSDLKSDCCTFLSLFCGSVVRKRDSFSPPLISQCPPPPTIPCVRTLAKTGVRKRVGVQLRLRPDRAGPGLPPSLFELQQRSAAQAHDAHK